MGCIYIYIPMGYIYTNGVYIIYIYIFPIYHTWILWDINQWWKVSIFDSHLATGAPVAIGSILCSCFQAGNFSSCFRFFFSLEVKESYIHYQLINNNQDYSWLNLINLKLNKTIYININHTNHPLTKQNTHFNGWLNVSHMVPYGPKPWSSWSWVILVSFWWRTYRERLDLDGKETIRIHQAGTCIFLSAKKHVFSAETAFSE